MPTGRRWSPGCSGTAGTEIVSPPLAPGAAVDRRGTRRPTRGRPRRPPTLSRRGRRRWTCGNGFPSAPERSSCCWRSSAPPASGPPRRLPSAIFPTVTFPRIKVIAETAEEPAAQMIPTLTRPLEEALLRVPGIERVTSTTTRGAVELGAEFAWSTDMQVALAAGAGPDRPRASGPASGDPHRRRVDEHRDLPDPRLRADLRHALLSELRELADFRLKPELNQIPGVSQVQVEGGTRREFQVRLDPQRLAGRKISASQVVDAIRRNDNGPLGRSGRVQSRALPDARHRETVGSRSALSNRRSGSRRRRSPSRSESSGRSRRRTPSPTSTRRPTGSRPCSSTSIRQPGASTLAIAARVDELFRAAARHPPEGRPVDPVLRPGRVRPGVGRRRARRHSHRRGPRRPRAAGLPAQRQDRR